jgi:hypothetical protein
LWRNRLEGKFRQKPIIFVKSTPQRRQKYNQRRLTLKAAVVEQKNLNTVKIRITEKDRDEFLQRCRRVALKLAQAEAKIFYLEFRCKGNLPQMQPTINRNFYRSPISHLSSPEGPAKGR